MNFPRFISSRIRSSEEKTFSSFVSRIALVSVAVGVASMLVSIAILKGFQTTIKEKLFSFGAHLTVTKYDLNESYESSPISTHTALFHSPPTEVAHIQRFCLKAALFKTQNEVMGILMKGVGTEFNQKAFQQNIISGQFLSLSDTGESKQILISQRIADKLQLIVGQEIWVYFIQNPPRYRKLRVCGIFKTDMDEFDENIVLCDISLLQKINHWADTLAGGLEIFAKNFATLDDTEQKVYNAMDYDLKIENIRNKYAHIFDWISLLDNNVIIFLSIILFVACFNIISTLLVLIMERTHMIGILKALGASDRTLMRIFIWNGAIIVGKGLLWGNALAMLFCTVQYYFKIIPLDARNYYMSYVPIYWDFKAILAVNAGAYCLLVIALLLPGYVIARIKPIKAIRFD